LDAGDRSFPRSISAQRRFNQERYAEAAHHSLRATELKPELADMHNLLGLACD